MKRIDKILLEQGFAASRTQAQKLVSSGAVKTYIQGQLTVLTKASSNYPDDIELFVDAIDELKYVSRAGLKLESAIRTLQTLEIINIDTLTTASAGKTVLDIGQSTGGFTDFLIQTGANKVVGIDVGHQQLAPNLRENHKVIALEGINARDLPTETLLEYSPGGFDWIVMDVSFISQTLIIPHITKCLTDDGLFISLVKPQFEAGKKNIGKGGVVRDASVFTSVKKTVCDCISEHGLVVQAYFGSGLVGADGNQEFFVVASKFKYTGSSSQ